MDITMIPLSAFRTKVNNCIDRYLSLSDRQNISIGLYLKGKGYIVALNDNETALFYDIGSISKTVTAHLILKLFNEKQLDLYSPVSDFLELKGKNYPSVYELLTHTAGYRHLTPLEITLPMLLRHRYSHRNPYEHTTAKSVLQALRRRSKKRTHHYSYSDFSYAILALVAESITDMDFYDLAQDFLHHELRMGRSHVIRETDIASAVYKGNTIPFWHWNRKSPYLAAGGLVSNLEDMLKYVALEIESQQDYIANAHRICQNSFWKRQNVGTCIGWHTYKKSNQLWHVGGVGTFRSSVIFNRKRRLGIVVLGNTKGVGSANVHYIAKMIYSEMKINKVFIPI